MSDNSHSIFKFKPFVFSGQTNNHREFQVPKFVDKKDVVYSDAYCIAYGVKMNVIHIYTFINIILVMLQYLKYLIICFK